MGLRIYFKTNLDEAQKDISQLNNLILKTDHSPIPRICERMVFTFRKGKSSKKFFYELEVCSISYDYSLGYKEDELLIGPTVNVELHIPSYYKNMSIDEWSCWLKRHREE